MSYNNVMFVQFLSVHVDTSRVRDARSSAELRYTGLIVWHPLQVGHHMWVQGPDGSGLILDRVVSTELQYDEGLYNPYTHHGTLFAYRCSCRHSSKLVAPSAHLISLLPLGPSPTL